MEFLSGQRGRQTGGMRVVGLASMIRRRLVQPQGSFWIPFLTVPAAGTMRSVSEPVAGPCGRLRRVEGVVGSEDPSRDPRSVDFGGPRESPDWGTRNRPPETNNSRSSRLPNGSRSQPTWQPRLRGVRTGELDLRGRPSPTFAKPCGYGPCSSKPKRSASRSLNCSTMAPASSSLSPNGRIAQATGHAGNLLRSHDGLLSPMQHGPHAPEARLRQARGVAAVRGGGAHVATGRPAGASRIARAIPQLRDVRGTAS